MRVASANSNETELSKTVLIVEDEILIRWVIAQHLRDCGYRVIEAGSGDEAVDILRRTALAVDVVFSDVQMPGSIDGFALAQWVRQRRPDIKVILTSGAAKAAKAVHELCESRSMISKPYSSAAIERKIRELLQR